MRTTVKRTREGYQQKTFDSFRQRQKWNDEVFYSVISLREGINLQLRTINRFGNDRKVCVKCQMLRIAEDREKEDLPEQVSQDHDYTETSGSFIIPAMRHGRVRDLSLRGKIAKPLCGRAGQSIAASGRPPKEQDTLGIFWLGPGTVDFINSLEPPP